MRHFWKLISHLFHPLFAPLAGVVAYFVISPEYHSFEVQRAIVLSTVILTIVIPVIFLLLFKNVGWIQSIHLGDVSDRKIPLYIGVLLIFIMARNVVFHTLTTELYYYFVGMLCTLIASLILVYFKFKASIHIMGISGFMLFVLGLSIHYEVNITLALALLALSVGLVASSRLYLKAHNSKELWIGLFVGAIPQLVVFKYWL